MLGASHVSHVSHVLEVTGAVCHGRIISTVDRVFAMFVSGTSLQQSAGATSEHAWLSAARGLLSDPGYTFALAKHVIPWSYLIAS